VADPIQSNSPLLQLSGLKEIKENVVGLITVLVVVVRVLISKVKRNKNINMVFVVKGLEQNDLVLILVVILFFFIVYLDDYIVVIIISSFVF
jgi:hypothetical protein